MAQLVIFSALGGYNYLLYSPTYWPTSPKKEKDCAKGGLEMQTGTRVFRGVQRAAGRGELCDGRRAEKDGRFFRGQKKRAAVEFSGGANVKQWKLGWAEVNKDC